jgi:hypothetical protein
MGKLRLNETDKRQQNESQCTIVFSKRINVIILSRGKMRLNEISNGYHSITHL